MTTYPDTFLMILIDAIDTIMAQAIRVVFLMSKLTYLKMIITGSCLIGKAHPTYFPSK